MRVNKWQKISISISALINIMMLLYPPFLFTTNRFTSNAGYSFILSPPLRGGLSATINTDLLSTQILVVSILGFAATIMLNIQPSFNRDSNQKIISVFSSVTFGCLRFLRLALAFYAIITIPSLASQFIYLNESPSITQLDLNNTILTFFYIVALVMGYILLEKIIHGLHGLIYKSKHPAITKWYRL